MRPVFVGGCDRSGTTLLGAMLGMHSECLTVPESQFKIEMLRCFDFDQDKTDWVSVLNMIKEHRRFRLWSLDIDSTSIAQRELGTSYPELIAWLVKRYGENLGKENCNLWIDHTPDNIRYAMTLLHLFPEAKMIHIVRDGRAVAASIMPLDWGPNTIIKAAYWWGERVAHGLAAEAFPEKKLIRIRYEDLVSAPEQTLKTLCAYLSIDYQAEMVEAHGFKVSRYTAGQHALVGKQPDVTRIKAWEDKLTSRQVEIFENLMGDFLRYFGYDFKYGLKAKVPTGTELLASDIRELYKKWIINRFRRRRRLRLIK